MVTDLTRVSSADLHAELARREDATIYALDSLDYGELTFNDFPYFGLCAEPLRIKIAGPARIVVLKGGR